MNEVFLLGRLTRDVELRTTASTSIARVGIAVDRRFSKDKDAVDFFNLVAFGKTAEFLQKYCRKGSKLIVEGRLQSSKYKDKYGDDRTSIEVVVEQVEFAEPKTKADDEDTPF